MKIDLNKLRTRPLARHFLGIPHSWQKQVASPHAAVVRDLAKE